MKNNDFVNIFLKLYRNNKYKDTDKTRFLLETLNSKKLDFESLYLIAASVYISDYKHIIRSNKITKEIFDKITQNYISWFLDNFNNKSLSFDNDEFFNELYNNHFFDSQTASLLVKSIGREIIEVSHNTEAFLNKIKMIEELFIKITKEKKLDTNTMCSIICFIYDNKGTSDDKYYWMTNYKIPPTTQNMSILNDSVDNPGFDYTVARYIIESLITRFKMPNTYVKEIIMKIFNSEITNIDVIEKIIYYIKKSALDENIHSSKIIESIYSQILEEMLKTQKFIKEIVVLSSNIWKDRFVSFALFESQIAKSPLIDDSVFQELCCELFEDLKSGYDSQKYSDLISFNDILIDRKICSWSEESEIPNINKEEERAKLLDKLLDIGSQEIINRVALDVKDKIFNKEYKLVRSRVYPNDFCIL